MSDTDLSQEDALDIFGGEAQPIVMTPAQRADMEAAIREMETMTC